MKNLDEQFMRRALELARLGGREVAPNPMVGAVIVKNGRIIGEGYHQKFGGPHAEAHAIRSVKNPEDLKGATIYVTLEPCRHYGKTPPCILAVMESGIERVVAGSADPFQKKFEIRISEIRNKYQISNTKSQIPNSKPRDELKIDFLKGSIAEGCRELNKFFFTWVTKKRPFITAKIAVSADGFVAGPHKKSVHLTNHQQDLETHRLRAHHQAIMVGIGTVLNGDPQLTVRGVPGGDPLRIILDSKLQIPLDAKVLKDSNVLVATCSSLNGAKAKELAKKGVRLWKAPTRKKVSLKKLFGYLGSIGISSVLVEPGPTLYRSLKKEKLIDELIVFKSRKKLREGLSIHL